MRRIQALFETETVAGLHFARRNLELVLDNLADGVMAHTMNRRIFYFNKAAEELTGFSRDEVLGKDCHKIFKPARFCGGDCSFCAGPARGETAVAPKTSRVSFAAKDGSKRILAMAIMPLADAVGKNVGALVSFKDTTELEALKERVRHVHTCGELIGKDPRTRELFEAIEEAGSVSMPVLILGESGTGKELVARAVHDLSPRKTKPFVAVNCGALPEGVLENELFGHVRGAYTGAVRDQRGRFELAHGGTIFLDEIAELSPAMQVKLLRVLQEHSFERVGGERPVNVDVRVIAATNQDLQALMGERRFRRDLYYRLCVIPMLVPPLRERKLDIPVLIDHFLDKVSKETGRPPISASAETVDLLTRFPWPGNVRELRNTIEYAYVKCRSGLLEPHHLPSEIALREGSVRRAERPGPHPKLTQKTVRAAMEEAKFNKLKAARLLKVGRSTLYRFLHQIDLAAESDDR
ncbi:MAG: PAS domain S-box protein [Myxococcales bacterium]|nr:MAG: PAS domain S-box protein [Myxococcales bacterium]